MFSIVYNFSARFHWVFLTLGLLFLSSFCNTLGAQQGPPNLDSTTGRQRSEAGSSSFADTLERPDLAHTGFNLNGDIRIPIYDLDTGLNFVHNIEPLYNIPFIAANLGSENSASLVFQKSTDSGGNRLGHSLYDNLLASLYEDEIIKVNRSFWSIHYGKGLGFIRNINSGSSHLDTKFYKAFARNIVFNFDYKRFTDAGSRLQSNEVGQLDFKLLQKSTDGNRISYLHYYSPSIEENLNPDSTTSTSGFVKLNRKRSTLLFGNSLLLMDTSTNAVRLAWDAQLKFFKNGYDVTSSSLGEEGRNLILLKVPGDTLTYHSKIKGVALSNKLQISKFGGQLSGEIELNVLQYTTGSSESNNYFETLLRLDFIKKLNNKIDYKINALTGAIDASGAYEVGGTVNYLYKPQLHLSLNVSLKSALIPLSQRKIYVNNTLFQQNYFSNITGGDISFEAEYVKTKSGIKVFYGNYKNLIYMREDGLYHQLPEAINMGSIVFNQELRIGPFLSKHSIIYQSISSDSFRPVQIQYAGNLHVKIPLFKKKMYTHLGTDVFYIPSFSSPGIFPIAGEFYNSLTSSKSGNVLLVNPYFNVKVDRLFFFVKGINAASRIFSSRSSLISGFPIYDYRIRFGIRWTLLD